MGQAIHQAPKQSSISHRNTRCRPNQNRISILERKRERKRYYTLTLTPCSNSGCDHLPRHPRRSTKARERNRSKEEHSGSKEDQARRKESRCRRIRFRRRRAQGKRGGRPRGKARIRSRSRSYTIRDSDQVSSTNRIIYHNLAYTSLTRPTGWLRQHW